MHTIFLTLSASGYHFSEGKFCRNTHRVSRRLTTSREAQTTYWQKFDVDLMHTYKEFHSQTRNITFMNFNLLNLTLITAVYIHPHAHINGVYIRLSTR